MSDELPLWHFYLPDEGRNSGWSNHTYILQLVCSGRGLDPEEAWAWAKDAGYIPPGFHLPEELIAIQDRHEETLSAH